MPRPRSPAARLAAVVAALVASTAGPTRAGVDGSVEEVKVGPRRMTAECFYPDAPGKYPLVLLLHGSGGLAEATGEVFRGIASGMAAQGYVVMIPHLFDAGKGFGAYQAAVKEAVAFAATTPRVDAGRVGLFGFSMGASLASLHAATDPRVKAIATVSGAPPVGARTKPPAMLFLNGSEDHALKSLKKLADRLDADGTPYEAHVYPGVPHNLDPETFFDAGRRALDFFERRLKNAPPTVVDEPAGVAEPKSKPKPGGSPKIEVEQTLSRKP